MVEYGRSTDLGLKVAGDLLLPEFGVESNRIELLAFVKLLLLTEAPCFSSAAIPSWSSRPFTLPMLIHCKFKQYELNWIKLLNFLFNHLIIFNRMNASVMWVMSLYGGMIFLPTFSASKYKARNATFTRRWPFRTARPGKRRFQTSARELAATLWIDMKQSNEFEVENSLNSNPWTLQNWVPRLHWSLAADAYPWPGSTELCEGQDETSFELLEFIRTPVSFLNWSWYFKILDCNYITSHVYI